MTGGEEEERNDDGKKSSLNLFNNLNNINISERLQEFKMHLQHFEEHFYFKVRKHWIEAVKRETMAFLIVQFLSIS